MLRFKEEGNQREQTEQYKLKPSYNGLQWRIEPVTPGINYIAVRDIAV